MNSAMQTVGDEAAVYYVFFYVFGHILLMDGMVVAITIEAFLSAAKSIKSDVTYDTDAAVVVLQHAPKRTMLDDETEKSLSLAREATMQNDSGRHRHMEKTQLVSANPMPEELQGFIEQQRKATLIQTADTLANANADAHTGTRAHFANSHDSPEPASGELASPAHLASDNSQTQPAGLDSAGGSNGHGGTGNSSAKVTAAPSALGSPLPRASRRKWRTAANRVGKAMLAVGRKSPVARNSASNETEGETHYRVVRKHGEWRRELVQTKADALEAMDENDILTLNKSANVDFAALHRAKKRFADIEKRNVNEAINELTPPSRTRPVPDPSNGGSGINLNHVSPVLRRYSSSVTNMDNVLARRNSQDLARRNSQDLAWEALQDQPFVTRDTDLRGETTSRASPLSAFATVLEDDGTDDVDDGDGDDGGGTGEGGLPTLAESDAH